MDYMKEIRCDCDAFAKKITSGDEEGLKKIFGVDNTAAGALMKSMYDDLAAASVASKNDKMDASEWISTSLYKHQRQALSWMKYRETQKPCGGLLGKLKIIILLQVFSSLQLDLNLRFRALMKHLYIIILIP